MGNTHDTSERAAHACLALIAWLGCQSLAMADAASAGDRNAQGLPTLQAASAADSGKLLTPLAAGDSAARARSAFDLVASDSAARAETQLSSPTLSTAQWSASRPRTRSMLVGFEATYLNSDLAVYGSDMATSFEYAGAVVMLFGDTYARRDSACDTQLGRSDDMIGLLPRTDSGGAPRLEIYTRTGAVRDYARVRLLRDGREIVLDQFKAALSGWSSAGAAYAMFQPQQPLTCRPGRDAAASGCPEQQGVSCMQNLSLCQPAPVTVPSLCEPLQPTCLLGGCTSSAVCVDTRSSQYDGSARGRAASMLSTVYIGKARAADLATFDTVATWRTNVFSHATARAVRHFSGSTSDADYRPGEGDLLIWGRPGWTAEQGRESRLYFARVPLPLPEAGAELRPSYFAGLDREPGQPRWSSDAAAAVPLAMDGQPDGDAHESLAIVGSTTVSWLGAPVHRWVMLYGGDVPDFMLVDPAASRRTNPSPGAVVMRFAEHPWGPWSPSVAHLPAGSPKIEGDAYGPGGIMFHPRCVDRPGARCARSDPYSLDLLGFCVMRPSPEPGRLYAPAIIDAYTAPNERGGLNITWAVSTWLPYAAYLMQTSIDPPLAP